MLASGNIYTIDLGVPSGNEADFSRPVIVVTSQIILAKNPSVVQVVPLATTIRECKSEVTIEPDPNNLLDALSAAQCQHIRAVSKVRLQSTGGAIDAISLRQIREILVLLLDA